MTVPPAGLLLCYTQEQVAEKLGQQKIREDSLEQDEGHSRKEVSVHTLVDRTTASVLVYKFSTSNSFKDCTMRLQRIQ